MPPLVGHDALAVIRNSTALVPIFFGMVASYLLLMINQFVRGHTREKELIRVRRDPFGEWFQLRKLSPLVYLLIRDGLIYFAMSVSKAVQNSRFSFAKLPNLGPRIDLCRMFCESPSPSCGSRLLIRVGEKQLIAHSTWQSPSSSTAEKYNPWASRMYTATTDELCD